MRPFDLNLLVAFDAIMAERSVTRAAQRICLGQPAMSHALSRLRDIFGDELFIRVAGKMEPTSKALELAGSIGPILTDIRRHVCAARAFDPDVAEVSFHLAANDYTEAVVLPAILEALCRTAPNMSLTVHSIDSEGPKRALESGIIDLAIGHFPGSIDWSFSELLLQEELECVFDPTVCNLSVPLSLASYLSLPHIDLLLCEDLMAAINAEIARKELDRFSLLRTPHVLALPFLLRRFEAVAAVPRRLAQHCVAFEKLRSSPLPLASRGFDISMHWHERTETNQAHRWFRQLVREVARSTNDDSFLLGETAHCKAPRVGNPLAREPMGAPRRLTCAGSSLVHGRWRPRTTEETTVVGANDTHLRQTGDKQCRLEMAPNSWQPAIA